MKKHNRTIPETEDDPEPMERVDLTQADLDRGLTPEQIARERADLNLPLFSKHLVQLLKKHAREQGEMWPPADPGQQDNQPNEPELDIS